jgi:predicted metalloprotease
MRWSLGRRSDNVIDERGGGMALTGGGIGILLIAGVIYLLGGDPRPLLETTSTGGRVPQEDRRGDPQRDFVSAVLADTEDTWNAVFEERFHRDYPRPKLVLFSGAVSSACGFAHAAVGPFYCPRDQRVYIDLSFYDELRERFHAPGDFAQAYVIAHEIGHHVQTVTGGHGLVDAQGASRRERNAVSVRVELQADCYAGLWAHHAQRLRNILEPGDVEEALTAASAIGDDRLQKESQGYVVPESFTHGTSQQRVTWFQRGFQTGTLEACDTFKS